MQVEHLWTLRLVPFEGKRTVEARFLALVGKSDRDDVKKDERRGWQTCFVSSFPSLVQNRFMPVRPDPEPTAHAIHKYDVLFEAGKRAGFFFFHFSVRVRLG